ncbi:hypothetical protein C2W62_38180 [Candidatus Entotheonella serta]|nr:hypothetical protein C2W62_38180 [Candidatus Entotheonella serta]
MGSNQRGNAGNITITTERLRVGGFGRNGNGRSLITSSTAGRGDAGRITIRAEQVIVSEGGRIATRSASRSARPNVIPRGNAGKIDIVATEIIINGGQILSTTSGPGAGGDVLLTADRLSLTDSGSIAVGSNNHRNDDSMEGDAGSIEIRVADTMHVAGDNSLISSDTSSSGDGGSVSIWAELLEITDKALIEASTSGSGDAGSIMIQASSMRIENDARIETTTVGEERNRGGNIHLAVGDLTVLDGRIQSSTSGRGDADSVIIEAADIDIDFGGAIIASQLGSGELGDAGKITITADRLRLGQRNDSGGRSRITSSTAGEGDAGRIALRTGQLIIEEGGRIATRTAPRSAQPDIVPEGNAGTIDIMATQIFINGGQVLSTTAGPDSGGDVRIQTEGLALTAGGLIAVASSSVGDAGSVQIMANNLSLTTGGAITVGSTDTGNAGSIRITVADTFRSDQGAITTESARAQGGDITLKARNVFLLDSVVTAEAMGLEPGTSDGGNIVVQGGQVVFNRSCIQANAFGGSGGNIQIAATDVYLASPDTVLDASSELGLAGTVEIASPVVDLAGALTPLTSTFDTASALLHNHCAVHQREERRASFIVQGRDRITIAPDGILPSILMPLRFP